MGEYGSFVRIVSKIYSNSIIYAYVDKKSFSGQVSIDDLVSVYNYKNINSDTKIFALLGYPLNKSFGHVFHNSQFVRQNKNAVYIKISLQSHELPIFFSYAKKFPFHGFSVTMPLKEKILSFLDEDKAQVNSINTILVKDQKFIGYNTDGIAALDAIERKIKIQDKKVLLIGAGGVAKAIAYEAIFRKANLLIFNRDQSKAYELAYKLQCKAFSLDKLEEEMLKGYDVLINATSSGMDDINIIPYERLLVGTIIMDVVVKPVETVLLKKAQERGCLVIYGMEVFINQAKKQFIDI
jgi:3-dehydroquinate dehydratase/shikimate dehydrogenase